MMVFDSNRGLIESRGTAARYGWHGIESQSDSIWVSRAPHRLTLFLSLFNAHYELGGRIQTLQGFGENPNVAWDLSYAASASTGHVGVRRRAARNINNI